MSRGSQFNWHFPQKDETMFLKTIQSASQSAYRPRPSSFQRHDIPGSNVKQQIPSHVSRQNYNNSCFIQAIPSSHVMKNKYIGSNNLRTDDIQHAQPRCNDFRTNRNTNPITPKYQLPYVAPVDPQPLRPFMRDTLDISDLKTKRTPQMIPRYQKQQIEGSQPNRLFRTVEAVSRLDVQDINKDGTFISKRTKNPTNPLEPSYTWRDTNRHTVNSTYGDIDCHPKPQIPQKINRRSDLSYSNYDIQGTKANSFNQRRYFLHQRRSIKDPLNTTDIPKSNASSLKKGITTGRQVNPLMPQYPYPSSRY